MGARYRPSLEGHRRSYPVIYLLHLVMELTVIYGESLRGAIPGGRARQFDDARRHQWAIRRHAHETVRLAIYRQGAYLTGWELPAGSYGWDLPAGSYGWDLPYRLEPPMWFDDDDRFDETMIVR